MEKIQRLKRQSTRPGSDRAEFVGVLINAVAFLASGVSAVMISTRFVLEDILAVLFVVAGAALLLAVLTVLLRREPLGVSKLRERLVSSYIEAIASSPLAPTHSRVQGRA